MTKSTLINITILIVCFFSLLVIFVRFEQLYSRCKGHEKSIALKSDSINNIVSLIEDISSADNCKLENLPATDIITHEPIELYDLLRKHQYSIIYRLVDTGCNSCNKKQIEKISYLQGKENVIVLSYLRNARQLRLFSGEIGIKIPIYQIDSAKKLFEGDNSSNVLIAYVDGNGMMLRIFKLKEETLWLLTHIVA